MLRLKAGALMSMGSGSLLTSTCRGALQVGWDGDLQRRPLAIIFSEGFARSSHVKQVPPSFKNAPVNTIALSCATTYYGYMTTWQPLKRAGYSNPISQLEAALIGGVVAV